MNHTSTFLSEISERGFLHQCTDIETLDTLVSKENNISAYIGFDCTADSLHVGSLIQIMLLRKLQQHGITPIILIGGGTSKVGDPSGKDKTRQLLTDEQLASNIKGITSIFGQFIDLDKALIVDNSSWLDWLNYIHFLRDVGKHFSVNRMLSFDSVKLRLEREQNLSFLEFNYMILQAYDFVKLFQDHGCRLQIGGSDQWGNIVNGVELGRRLGTAELFGLTTPLLTTASGAKMGKTESGAIWLSKDKLSAYDYWQFWRNVEDQDVERFLLLFTELPVDEIKQLATLKDNEINEAKKVLANEATTLCHGAEEAANAAKTAQKVFEQGSIGDDLPTINIDKASLDVGIPAFKLFHIAGLCESGGAARRLIRGGGGKINDTKCDSEETIISSNNINSDGVIKLSAGKKHHALLKVI